MEISLPISRWIMSFHATCSHGPLFHKEDPSSWRRTLQRSMMKSQTTSFPLLWYRVSLSWRVWACWSRSQKSPLMKEITTTDDLGDLLWLMISKKAQRSHHQRNQIPKIIAKDSKCMLSEKSMLRATKIWDIRNLSRWRSEGVTPHKKFHLLWNSRFSRSSLKKETSARRHLKECTPKTSPAPWNS